MEQIFKLWNKIKRSKRDRLNGREAGHIKRYLPIKHCHEHLY